MRAGELIVVNCVVAATAHAGPPYVTEPPRDLRRLVVVSQAAIA
jgi:hypothetical protein